MESEFCGIKSSEKHSSIFSGIHQICEKNCSKLVKLLESVNKLKVH